MRKQGPRKRKSVDQIIHKPLTEQNRTEQNSLLGGPRCSDHCASVNRITVRVTASTSSREYDRDLRVSTGLELNTNLLVP